MASPDTVSIQVEVLCDTCKKELVVVSSHENTTPNAAAKDGFFRVYTSPCENCMRTATQIEYIQKVDLRVNGEPFTFEVDYD